VGQIDDAGPRVAHGPDFADPWCNCSAYKCNKYLQFILLKVFNELQYILMTLTTMERLNLLQHFQTTMLPRFLLDNLMYQTNNIWAPNHTTQDDK